MIFESHSHYDDSAFDADREQILNELSVAGIERVINVSASLASAETTMALAESHPFVYAAIGVHPDETAQLSEDGLQRLQELCRRPKTVAVGEIGLDYYWDKTEREVQKTWFRRQIALAKEEGLPLIIHSREAARDTMDILKEENAYATGGVMHCFSYSQEIAEEVLRNGWYLGIGGVVTFQNAKRLKEVVQMAPMERILLETDCPYLAPVPYRGKRNSSLYLPYVIETIAQIKGVSTEETERTTYDNAMRLFFNT